MAPLPQGVHDRAIGQVKVFCRKQVPSPLKDKRRVEYEVRGAAITIVEARAPRARNGDWSQRKIARLKYDEGARTWTLCRLDAAKDRWVAAGDDAVQPDVEPLLRRVHNDPDREFWG